jgi:hypothetical protein
MRIFGMAVLVLTAFNTLTAQTYSTRLSSMGGVSLAVPDPSSEAFINPAKMAKLSGLQLRLTPGYLKYSIKEEESYSYAVNDNNKNSEEYKQNESGISGDFHLQLFPFHIGGLYNTAKSYNKTTQTSGYNSPFIPEYSTEYSTPSNKIQLQAAFCVSDLSIGASGFLSNQKETYTRKYNNPNYIYEYETQTIDDNKGGSIGAFYDFSNLNEVSILFSRSSVKIEDKQPTREVQNGNSYPINFPYLENNSGNVTSIDLETRLHPLEKIILGIGFNTDFGTSDQTVTQTWTSYQNPAGIYEARKNEKSDLNSYRTGVGLTYITEVPIIFSLEFWRGSTELKTSTLFTNNSEPGTTPVYKRGNISSESTEKTIENSLRVGIEIGLAEILVMRAGSQIIWTSSETEYKSKINNYISKNSGTVDAHIIPSVGLGIKLSPLHIDYALTALKKDIPYYYDYIYYLRSYSISPGTRIPYYIPSMSDIAFNHQITLSVEL